MAKARYEHAKTTRGWGKAAPKPGKERSLLAKRCGFKAFLKPNRKTPGQSKFPIMSKGSTACKPDCRGLRTAYQRADQYGYSGVARRALSLAKKNGCDWTE